MEEAEDPGVAAVAAVAAGVVLGRAGVTRIAIRRSKRDVTAGRGSRELRVAGQARHEDNISEHADRSVVSRDRSLGA